MNKRLFAGILSVFMTFAALAGCSSEQKPQGDSSPSSSPAEMASLSQELEWGTVTVSIPIDSGYELSNEDGWKILSEDDTVALGFNFLEGTSVYDSLYDQYKEAGFTQIKDEDINGNHFYGFTVEKRQQYAGKIGDAATLTAEAANGEELGDSALSVMKVEVKLNEE